MITKSRWVDLFTCIQSCLHKGQYYSNSWPCSTYSCHDYDFHHDCYDCHYILRSQKNRFTYEYLGLWHTLTNNHLLVIIVYYNNHWIKIISYIVHYNTIIVYIHIYTVYNNHLIPFLFISTWWTPRFHGGLPSRLLQQHCSSGTLRGMTLQQGFQPPAPHSPLGWRLWSGLPDLSYTFFDWSYFSLVNIILEV